MISSKNLYLRPVLRSDAPQILEWENDPSLWEVTETKGPFTLEDILYYIEQSNDLWENSQLRLMICDRNTDDVIGAVDLFDFNAHLKKAGIGILIGNPTYRNRGFGFEALNALVTFATVDLRLHQLECIIHPDNHASIRIFEKCNFKPTGVSYFKDRRVIKFVHSTTL
ncbi:MAG: hypothetical protein RLZZ77_1009 [Bacteroidota bacterium]|jgi:diamine N-acetyltransferase